MDFLFLKAMDSRKQKGIFLSFLKSTYLENIPQKNLHPKKEIIKKDN